MNLGSFFGPLVVLCYFFLAAAASRKTEGKKEEWINFLQDPRQNESLYDLAVRKSTSYGEMIGSVSEILIKKGLINATTRINKYKLIYFSPQVISVEKKLSDTAQNNSSIQSGESPTGGSTFFGTTLNEPLFTVSSVNGSIHIFTPSNEPTLEYLCVKKSICSCFSCIFSLNVIYSLDFNRIKADTIRVFVDDFNDYAPEFYSVQSELVLNISEASRVGDRFRVENARAYDLDAFYNQVSYYLSDKEVVPQESNMDRSLLSGLFEIEQQDDESTNERDLILVLKAHLDYETKRRYVIYLVASDNGRTNINGVVVKDVLRASKKLVVNVVDENDNTPVCEKSMFIESVKENRIERDFLQIRAVDPDSGLNSKLKFTIERATSKNRNPTSSSSDQTDNDEDLFDINRDTGWLSLRKTLDYEKKSSYDLVVRVSDSGLKTSFSIRCLARINVLDMNDNQAQIKVIKYLNESMGRGYYSFSVQAEDEVASDTQLSSSEYMDVDLGTSSIRNQIELYENNSPNVVLALIRVFDRDSLSNYKFIIQSVTNNFHEETSMFEIRPVADSNGTKSSNREYELVASGVFNAELIQNYKLRITLYDLDDDVYYHQSLESLDEKVMSGDAASSEFNFCVSLVQRVHVLDLNDNKPEFSRKYYEFRLRENEENVTLTTGHQIEVYDLDSSERNSNITFKMSDKLGQLNASDYFELSTNKNYPNLVAKKSFDYETDGSQFEFYLSAYDVDNLTDTALIKIRIDDVNDNPPMFINDNSTFYIKENTPVNSFIGQVIALDKDSPGPNSDVSFRIVSEHLRSLFKVYKTGVLSNWIEFDREVQSFYSIHIEAYDNGQPNSLTTMGTFYIRVEDENDCAPYFYYPKESTKFMNIKFPSLNQSNFTVNNTTQRLKLLNVKAFDDDLEDNGKIVYYLSDSRPSFLSIDRQNGTLYFDYTNMTFSQFILFKSVVNVSIWASDCGTPSLNSSINLTLFLNYDSDELPDYLFNNRAHKSPNDINNHKFNTLLDSLGHKTTLDKIDTETHSRAYDHVIQILLNNFLLIFLVAILCLIIFITCFVFVTIYKRSFSASLSCCNIEKSRRSGTKNLRLLTSHIQDFLNNRGNVRTKTTSVFKNLSSSNVSQHDNLTVSFKHHFISLLTYIIFKF